jgi:hypothetical protein
MISRLQGAIDMAKLFLLHSKDPALRRLAQDRRAEGSHNTPIWDVMRQKESTPAASSPFHGFRHECHSGQQAISGRH